MTLVRPARDTDLRALYDVFYQNEVLDSIEPPAIGATPPYLRHVLQTGKLHVAEQDAEILAYAGTITRGTISFLTDLFVRPGLQSGQVGKSLLHSILPDDGLVHFTVSSSDYRALSLYIRAGMRPHWPVFALGLEKPEKDVSAPSGIECREAAAGAPELIQMDEQIGGRLRPMDHEYWIREERAVPLWFRRADQIVGYGYIRLDAGTLWHHNACSIGPIGVIAPDAAVDCVLAAIHWAIQRAEVIHLEVPGPHPSLMPLLERGFRIRFVDTFVSSAATPFFDAQCYIPSGGDLF